MNKTTNNTTKTTSIESLYALIDERCAAQDGYSLKDNTFDYNYGTSLGYGKYVKGPAFDDDDDDYGDGNHQY